MVRNIGILGIGVELPPTIRRNDWWPEEIVAKWRAHRAAILPGEEDANASDPGHRALLEALAPYADDPFAGAVERRIADPEVRASDLETAAAREALLEAGVGADEVGLLLSYSPNPDYLHTPTGCAVHHRLGGRADCLTLAVESGCNTFVHQVGLARAYLQSGAADFALLTQSSLVTTFMPPEAQRSAWFGEGATAVLLGPVEGGRGIIDLTHRTEGSTHDVLVSGVIGKRWHEEGTVRWYPQDKERGAAIILEAPGNCKEAVDDLFTRTGFDATDVDFFAGHQATAWLPALLQRAAGLESARTLSTFSWTGSLTACNLPIILATAAREGMLRRGDLVVGFTGGTGTTYSALMLRW